MVDKMIGASVPTDDDLKNYNDPNNVNPKPPQAESVAVAEEEKVSVTADGQNITFKDGILTINKAYDLTGEDGQKYFSGVQLAGGWFNTDTYNQGIILKFTSPIPNGKVQALKFTSPSNVEAQDYTGADGVTYYFLGFAKTSAAEETETVKTIKVQWGDTADENNLQQPIEIKIVDQRTGN